jgi:hypothetical protein
MENQTNVLKSYHGAIHKILCLFEMVDAGEVAFSDYIAYLENVYVRFLGINHNIAVYIKGLSKMPRLEQTHLIVRRIVMDMHSILDKEGIDE